MIMIKSLASQDTVVLGVNTHLLTRRAQDRIPSPNSFERERNGEERKKTELIWKRKRNENRHAREQPVTLERAQNQN